MKRILVGMAFVILFICLGGWAWKKYVVMKMNQDTEVEMIILRQAQYICDATKLIEALQKKNIPVDQKYIDEVREKEKFMIENFESVDTTLDAYSLGMLLYLNEYYGEGVREEILKLLEKYYIEKSKLFSMLPVDKSKNAGTKKNELKNVEWTESFLRILGEKKGVVSQYRLEEGLAEWFNRNVKKSSDEEVKSTLQDIFWYFYDNNKLNQIEYEKAKIVIKNDVDRVKEYVNEEEPSITKVGCIQMMDAYMQLFENDDFYQGMAEETFNQIRTLETVGI